MFFCTPKISDCYPRSLTASAIPRLHVLSQRGWVPLRDVITALRVRVAVYLCGGVHADSLRSGSGRPRPPPPAAALLSPAAPQPETHACCLWGHKHSNVILTIIITVHTNFSFMLSTTEIRYFTFKNRNGCRKRINKVSFNLSPEACHNVMRLTSGS